MNTATNRRGWLVTALGFLALPLAIRGAATRPGPHKLDRLYDELARTWSPAAEAEMESERAGDVYWKDRTPGNEAERERAWAAFHVADAARRRAYHTVLDAVLETAGVGVPARLAYESWGKPFATVRTARRVYMVLADSGGEWDAEHLGCCEVVALEL